MQEEISNLATEEDRAHKAEARVKVWESLAKDSTPSKSIDKALVMSLTAN